MHDRLVSRRIDALHQCFLVHPVVVSKIVESVATSADPDQTPRSAASDLGLHC